MNLYTTHAQEFSITRKYPWKGWRLLKKKLNDFSLKPLTCLDLGCGNGRFLKFLSDNLYHIDYYLGIDNSEFLLDETSQLVKILIQNGSLSRGEVENSDLNRADWSIKTSSKFNYVAAFGIFHHIESFEARKNLLQKSLELLDEEGYLIVTYWQFKKFDRYSNKITEYKIDSSQRFSENDYIMSFGDENAQRFCHYVSESELSELEKDLNLKVFDSFESDGRENNENLYRIYKKL